MWMSRDDLNMLRVDRRTMRRDDLNTLRVDALRTFLKMGEKISVFRNNVIRMDRD